MWIGPDPRGEIHIHSVGHEIGVFLVVHCRGAVECRIISRCLQVPGRELIGVGTESQIGRKRIEPILRTIRYREWLNTLTPPGGVSVMIGCVEIESHTPLFEVGKTLDRSALLLEVRHSREKQRRQGADDRECDHQLNQRESREACLHLGLAFVPATGE